MRINPATVGDLVTHLFIVHGAPEENAAIVAEHLLESERLHLPSHGLLRVRQYLNEISAGLLLPSSVPTLEAEYDTIVHIDGHLGFGQVAGLAAANAAERLAGRYGSAFVTVRNVQHTGRLGAYTEPLAAKGLFAIAVGSGAPRFHRVVPFGGRDGRISTNPIAWAAPTLNGVISADLSTSAMPEGRIRVLHEGGAPAPPDTICDADGTPTTDTRLFYGDPSADLEPGALLPLGGQLFGHKGYALGLLSECMATILAGDRTDIAEGRANNLAVIAIRSDPYFADRVSAMAHYVKSSRPRTNGSAVLVPGEPERRDYSPLGPIELPDFVWSSLAEDFKTAGITIPVMKDILGDLRYRLRGEVVVGVYFLIETVTREGMLTVDEAPARAQGVLSLAKRYGVTVEEFFYTTGDSDFLMKLQAPDDESVAVFMMSLRRSGNVTVRCLKAYTPETWAAFVGRL